MKRAVLEARYHRLNSVDCLHFLYAVYVNTYLAIATGQEPWQRSPSVDKATPFSRTSIVSFE